MKKLLSIVSVIVILMLLCVSPISIRTVKGDSNEKFGVVTSNGVEMFKSKDGETYPIVTIDGKKYVEWNDYEIIALDDAINCESGKSDIMLKKFISQYYENYRKNNPPKFYAEYYNVGDRDGYNQMWPAWANQPLGYGPDSIGVSGCLLCSTASELLRYGLKDPKSGGTINPLNLNDWLKNNGGFPNHNDEMYYGAIQKFPGIYYVIPGFDDFNTAYTILYRVPPNAPIECFRTQDKLPCSDGIYRYKYHFCLYVDGDGINPYHQGSDGKYYINPDEGNLHKVIDPGFNGTSDPRGTVRTLTMLYDEGKTYKGSPYTRPDSGIFRVAYRNY